MSYQPRVRSAIWTTLVLLLVGISATSALAQQNLAAAPVPSSGVARGADKQSEQGKQYGQPGFVGEPINLNVVNADIRDIRFERCDIKTSCRGLTIQLRDSGNVANVEFRDIRFVARYHSAPWWGRGEAISLRWIPECSCD